MDLIKKVLTENLIEELAEAIFKSTDFAWQDIEEIRMRINRPVFIKCHGKEYILKFNNIPIVMDKIMVKRAVMVLSKSSFYAFEDEMKQGFITIKGGHRIGLCGEAVLENDSIKTLKNINGINFRIGREILGVGRCLVPYIVEESEIKHTLIVAPPAVGKTTVLRDLARIFGDGEGVEAVNVGIADERLELSGCFLGVPQLNIGERTDVISGCSKADGMMMLIRSMAPRLIVTDEIGKSEDADAMLEAINCGVKIITSAHGNSFEGLIKRPIISGMIKDSFFERIVFIDREETNTFVKAVYDSKGNKLC